MTHVINEHNFPCNCTHCNAWCLFFFRVRSWLLCAACLDVRWTQWICKTPVINSLCDWRSPILLIAKYDQHREYIDGTLVPACLTEANTFWPSFFFIMIITVFFLLPLCMLVVLYAMMARHLMADPGTSAVKDAESSNSRARKQVVLMLGTVVLSFFICLIPFRVFTLWFIVVPEEQVQQLGMEGYYNILYFCRTMLYLNSAVNPILYNLMSSKFRNGFMRLCGLRRGELSLVRRGTTSTSVYSSTRRGDSFRMTQRNSPDWNERRHRTSFRRSIIIRTSKNYTREDIFNCVDIRPGPESYVWAG